MATLATNLLTLLDAAKRLEPDGSTAAIAELLSQDNEILEDMLWMEGNLPTGHRVTQRTGLPTVAFRKLNQGVAESKSTTAQIDEACGMLEGFGKIDKDLAELNGNTAEFRLSENYGFIEAMNQEMATALFYGDHTVDPEKFLGLSERYSSLSAGNSQNIINAGGSGSDNTSIWLIGWGPHSIHGIYPKGSTAGLKHEDLGLDTVTDSQGRPFRAYRDHYQWKCGIALKDWGFAVRIANIDVSDLTKNASSGADLIDLMTRASERMKSMSGVKLAWYCNRTVRAFLRRQMVAAVKNSTLAMDTVAGKRVVTFDEIPVRRSDAILNNEAAIS